MLIGYQFCLQSPILNIDVAPTIIELAGGKVPSSMDGKSIVPLLVGCTCVGRVSFLLSFHPILYLWRYLGVIPLISRVRGPYSKLWTEFFPSFYGPSAKRAGHENKEGKNEDP